MWAREATVVQIEGSELNTMPDSGDWVRLVQRGARCDNGTAVGIGGAAAAAAGGVVTDFIANAGATLSAASQVARSRAWRPASTRRRR